MASSIKSRPISDEKLAAIFGEQLACPRAVLKELAREPDRVWRLEELVAATGERSIDVAMAVSRLTHVGFIEHPAAGVYRAQKLLSGQDGS